MPQLEQENRKSAEVVLKEVDIVPFVVEALNEITGMN